jgi:hypothetical protein
MRHKTTLIEKRSQEGIMPLKRSGKGTKKIKDCIAYNKIGWIQRKNLLNL